MSKYLRVGSAIKAGLIATLTMTLFMYAGPLVRLPRMDVMGSLGSLIPGSASPYPAGALLHFGFGATLALIYAALFARLLPSPSTPHPPVRSVTFVRGNLARWSGVYLIDGLWDETGGNSGLETRWESV